MKIIKFRIKDYKSIEDSGDCFLTDSITILAGKNESGKTSILEALEDFDTDTKIREDAIPIKRPDALPTISITFEIDRTVVNDILDRIGAEKIKSNKCSLELMKTYPDTYTLCASSEEELGLKSNNKKNHIDGELKEMWSSIKSIHEMYLNLEELCLSIMRMIIMHYYQTYLH